MTTLRLCSLLLAILLAPTIDAFSPAARWNAPFPVRGLSPQPPPNAQAVPALSYSTISDPPLQNQKNRSASAFEKRMRKLVLSKPATKAPSTHPSCVATITSLADYKQRVVDDSQGTRLTVVRFYADYCRACRAMTPAFYRLAQRHSADDNENDTTHPNERGASVRFAQVPVTSATTAIHQGLQVPSVPFGHVYHPTAGLVEEVRLRQSSLADFAKILESYVVGSCALPAEPDATTGIFEAPYVRET
jgi:thiol-disulfide isomerase/thioredoxin